MSWRIELLGAPRIRHGQMVIDRFRTQKGILLLAYLGSPLHRVHSREELAEVLWPEEDPERQRGRLRYELSVLRKATWPGLFHTPDNVQIALSSDVTCDVAEFESALRAAARATGPSARLPYLEAAVALYRDDLLPGSFEDWVLQERERLRERLADTLLQLYRCLDMIGMPEAARLYRTELERRFPERDDLLTPSSVGVPRRQDAGDTRPGRGEEGFHGRDEELRKVRTWIKEKTGRLLIIRGLGGIGKTRLVREAVHTVGALKEGITPLFLSLASVTDAARLWETLASELSVGRTDDDLASETEEPRDIVLSRLRESTETVPLLILDNFEQIAGGDMVLEDLLSQCSRLRCLVTSRIQLNRTGVEELLLLPLPEGVALALFLDRARAVRPGFALTVAGSSREGAVNVSSSGSIAQGATEITEICRLLEGIPLAIELAATRVADLGAAEIKGQLMHRLRFLATRQTQGDERHASLQSALEWSLDLFAPELQTVFSRLCLLQGTFSLTAAEAVCEEKESARMPVVNALEDLRRHSFVTVLFDGDTAPFRTGETVRWQFLTTARTM
ncbi:MAG: hypothetical protein H8F28_27600 [Fibrella sp.]|nr:hypothetical protein [Armatimonadota bacterium]